MFVKIAFLAAAAALLVSLAARSSNGAGPERSYVVKPADTLWSIAVSYYGGDPREGVWKLERRNGLHGALLRPGQRLVLP
jgi:nucleoid-associated protein YgaU